MYALYKSQLTPSYTFSYPSYGTSYYGVGSKWINGDYTITPYTYGRKRRKLYYWERHAERCRDRKKNRRGKGSKPLSPVREVTPPPPPAPPKPVIPEADLAKELYVTDVDFHIKANTKKHRTDDFNCTKSTRKVDGKPVPAELVVRRGDSMKMTITFDRPYSKEKNDLDLRFTLGKDPNPIRGTQVTIKVDESGKQMFKPGEWGATLQGKTGNDITILVRIPANCIIGDWNVSVITTSEGKNKHGGKEALKGKYEHDEDITILFNPWCKDDGTYMATQNLLNEYVLNDKGAVWRGNSYQIGAKQWFYGQFEEDILDIVLELLTDGLSDNELKIMSDPVKVSRRISKMVNSSDDNGVLTGRWDGNYEDGTPPYKWGGSVKILRQWQKSGPVQYGQCWVFACLTTTVCRALGIPARTVTNFSSAHDTDCSSTIDKYFQRIEGTDEPMEGYDGSHDSVWNFHVWNEVWLARPDLPADFKLDGWQVIDATPQELSGRVYQCGPSPLAAIRRGLCNIDYDTGFVFAEVNADEISWRVHSNKQLQIIEIKKHKIGKMISTKTPTGEPFDDSDVPWYEKDKYAEKNRLELDLDYKFREGSEEERESVKKAQETSAKKIVETYVAKETVKPIKFSLTHGNNVMIGCKMEVEFKAKNNGKYERKIPLAVISAIPKGYTGNYGKMFHRKFFGDKVTLKPGEEKIYGTVLEPADYLPNLDNQASFSIIATSYVESVGDEEEQTVRKEHTVRFRRPELSVKGPKVANAGDRVTFVVSFTNPLDQPMTGCNVSMDSDVFDDLDDIPTVDIPAKGEYCEEFTLEATLPKKKAGVIFNFESSQVKDISGSAVININEA